MDKHVSMDLIRNRQGLELFLTTEPIDLAALPFAQTGKARKIAEVLGRAGLTACPASVLCSPLQPVRLSEKCFCLCEVIPRDVYAEVYGLQYTTCDVMDKELYTFYLIWQGIGGHLVS